MSQEKLKHLRLAAREIFSAALRAVDARDVTSRAISVKGERVQICDSEIEIAKPVYVISIGKAALSMSLALNEKLGDKVKQALITSPRKSNELPASWRQFAGGHPLPNSESLNAAREAFNLIEKANLEQATLIFAISGGGSAMVEWPVNEEISLTDLAEANRVLVTSGATIAEINTVRRAFSAVKGGKLAKRAKEARIITLIISDTNRGDEASVASGPTIQPRQTTTSAAQIIDRFALDSKLPESIVRTVRQSESGSGGPLGRHPVYVLAHNGTAIEAARGRAQSLGFEPVVARDIAEQPIDEGCSLLLERLVQSPCLISGGEFSCTVRGTGRGGRNLETVLRCAMELERQKVTHNVVVLSGGTDGIDGNSPAAGAIADETTLVRARKLGLNASDYLARSDSYVFFEKLGDTIDIGPTGTNVRDIRILLKH